MGFCLEVGDFGKKLRMEIFRISPRQLWTLFIDSYLLILDSLYSKGSATQLLSQECIFELDELFWS